MNFLTISINKWQMPVYIPKRTIPKDMIVKINSILHKIYSNKKQVKFHSLCDRFHIKNHYYSLGDIFLVIGLVFFLLNL